MVQHIFIRTTHSAPDMPFLWDMLYEAAVVDAPLKMLKKEDVLLLYLLDQPKFAKSGLIHAFKDNNQIIGFIGLYTDFHFDFATSDTHYISDISNYIKTYYIEFEKNKIIERKNKEIEAQATELNTQERLKKPG